MRSARYAVLAGIALIAAAAVALAFASAPPARPGTSTPGATSSARAKNVILMIGDGMDATAITMARYYLKGAEGTLAGLDALPVTGQVTATSLDKDSGLPDYVADSAATASALATGVRTYDRAISVDLREQPQQTLLQYAQQTGRRTGNVTTSAIADATPAAQVAHVVHRDCVGPDATATICPSDAKENGGRGSIAEQLLDTRPDVTLGGGRRTFDEEARAGEWAGRTLEEQAEARGYRYVTEPAELAEVRAASRDAPLLGLFDGGDLPVKFAAQVATPDGATRPASTCEIDLDWGDAPALADLTRRAIELLDADEPGFFLQVESASIDERAHAADACGQIGETEQLDEAVQVALDFAERDGNTLLVVTADHAHAAQIVAGDTLGYETRLRTVDGSDLLVAYSTAESAGLQQHTGVTVPVAAFGPGAAGVAGLLDQTDLHALMRSALET